MRYLLALAAALVMIQTVNYTYHKGLQDGEQRYKESRRMYLALKSAYHFGYIDAHEGRPEDWDGPELADSVLLTPDSLCMANITEQDIQDIANQSGYTVTGLQHSPRWVTLDGKECK